MDHRKSVYHAGASDGLVMGTILSGVFLANAYAERSAMLSLAGLALMLSVPFVAYHFISRGYRLSGYTHTLSAMWMHGIMTFICGSLIMAIVMYVYTRLLNPLYIVNQVEMVAGIYRQMGTAEAVRIADTFDKLIAQHMLPTPIGLAFTMIWFVSFFGSILSLFLSLIARGLAKIKGSNPNYRQ